MIGWIITHDHTTGKKDQRGCYLSEKGRTSFGWNEEIQAKATTKFILKDDDGIVYYRGLLIDDDYCDSQEDVLEWGKNFAGCTSVWIKRAGRWTMDIG